MARRKSFTVATKVQVYFCDPQSPWQRGTFARTTRFQRALDAKRFFPCRTWLSIAHEFGYFDQMHMVRDFQLLCGVTPNNFLDLSGDIQPWSLPAHKTLELR
jgi:Bacterial regulatory helix-turn-helix proteins, AraC family